MFSALLYIESNSPHTMGYPGAYVLLLPWRWHNYTALCQCFDITSHGSDAAIQELEREILLCERESLIPSFVCDSGEPRLPKSYESTIDSDLIIFLSRVKRALLLPFSSRIWIMAYQRVLIDAEMPKIFTCPTVSAS